MLACYQLHTGILVCLPVESIGFVCNSHLDGAIVHEELVLLDKDGQRTLQNAGIVGVANVGFDHLRQQRGLRTVQVVEARAVGNEAKLLNEIQKVLNGVLGNVDECAARAKKAFDNPVRVPVIGFTEAATRNYKGPVDGDEAVGAVGAVADGRASVLARQIRPDINDLVHEFLDDGIVELVDKLGISLELVLGDSLELATGIIKVRVKEIVELSVVGERLLKFVKCSLNLRQWFFRGPGRMLAVDHCARGGCRGGCNGVQNSVLHVNKCLGVCEWPGQLDLLENISMAVDWRVARSDDGAILVQGSYHRERSCQSSREIFERRHHCCELGLGETMVGSTDFFPFQLGRRGLHV